MEEEENEKESKVEIITYVLSIIVFILGFIPVFSGISKWLFLASLLLAGYEVLIEGIKSIFKLEIEEDTLMAIAMIAAFILGEYPESCAIILLFKLGEFIEGLAEKKSESNIEDIVKIKANVANLITENGTAEEVDVENVKIGDKILIKPGDKVPVDCIIISGESNLDTSAITGESKPQTVKQDTEILSGSINLTSVLTCKVIREYKDSMATQIVNLVYEAKNNKGKAEKFITKFAKIYTPIVVILAIAIAIIPALLGYDLKTWVLRALIFVVASCPCSMVISIPLAFFSCVGAISKKGMLVKGTMHIEKLSKIKKVALDKTGTITTGKMKISKIETLNGFDENTVLKYMYNLERLSNHPISTAVIEKVENKEILEVTEHQEIAGFGIYGKIEGKEVVLGNKKLLAKFNINANDDFIYLAVDGIIAGYITLEEELREGADKLVEKLKTANVKDVIMLTGDNQNSASKISEKVGIKTVYSGLLPEEKVNKIKEAKNDGNIMFVGDGINDGPVLAESDFGVSIGEGTEIANSISDAILMSNNIAILSDVIKIAKKSMGIVKFNIIFSILVKVIVLTLGVLGLAPVWLAVLADTGTTVITVINSFRIFKNR